MKVRLTDPALDTGLLSIGDAVERLTGSDSLDPTNASAEKIDAMRQMLGRLIEVFADHGGVLAGEIKYILGNGDVKVEP